VKNFLREYWLWMLLPALLLVVLLAVAWFLQDPGDPPGTYAL